MLGGRHEPIPVGVNVLRRAADLGDDHSHVLGWHHFNSVPGADGKFVGVRLLAGDVDADLAADTAFEVDLAPLLGSLDDAAVDLLELNAIDRTDFETRLAASAVVGVNDRQLFRNFFTGTGFGHGRVVG